MVFSYRHAQRMKRAWQRWRYPLVGGCQPTESSCVIYHQSTSIFSWRMKAMSPNNDGSAQEQAMDVWPTRRAGFCYSPVQ